jgi:putative inorganic carbon (HCO3(-)) transporter
VSSLGVDVGRQKALAFAGLGAVAVGIAFVASRWPLIALGAAVAVVAVAIVLQQLTAAVALLAASFFFTNYLSKGAGVLTVDKAIGGLAVAAWLLDWALGRRDLVTVRHLWIIGGMIVWIGVSLTVARNESDALTTALRYLLFFILFFLVVQTIQGDRRRAEILVTAVVLAATVAAIIGLAAFLTHKVTRANGPLQDPNDFGFLLGTTVPLALFRLKWSRSTAAKVAFGLQLVVIFAAILATFSRSTLLGLTVAGLWAVITRRLMLRWGLTILLSIAVIAGIGFLYKPQVVLNAFDQKTFIADTNVSTRFFLWNIAVKEFASAPLTGVGPGNYQVRLQEFGSSPPNANLGTLTTHNAYLNVLAETGAPGLLLFLGFLVYSWVYLRRRFPDDPRTDALQGSIAAGFIVAVVGAMFLTEQFYPPFWFLSAIGVSLAVGPPAQATAAALVKARRPE